MRLITILLMSVCALVVSAGVMADDMLSTLIGDNKVWNYVTTTYFHEKPVNTFDSYSLYCNGSVEKNGKVYAVVAYQKDNTELAYIREEDGRIYISSESPVFGLSYGPESFCCIHPDFTDIPEFTVFDFNAREGDSYKGLVNCAGGYKTGEIQVKKIEVRTVDEREVRIFDVSHNEIDNGEDGNNSVLHHLVDRTVVEGIGYLNDFFFMPDPVDYTTSIFHDGPDTGFKSLTDKNGDKIITVREIFPPAPYERKYAHTIRTDRTWVYSFVKDGIEETRSLHFGERVHTDYGYFHPLIDEKGDIVAHMAYFYNDDSILSRYAEDNPEIARLYNMYDYYDGESWVYCFNPRVMDCYQTASRSKTTGEYKKITVNIESCETVIIDGENCRRLIVTSSRRPNEKFVVIEGIGADTGWLYEPAWGDREAEEANGLATLREVLDGEGNVIFRHEDFGPTGAVEGIEDDCAAEADTRMFDLFGREIRDPQPGTIYVQGGRKFVAQ